MTFHCPHCGAPLGAFVLADAGHASCLGCRQAEWRNPLPVAGVLLVREGQVLLVRRARTMSRAPGMWAYPGGFVEAGETAEGAALRETFEEVRLPARITGIVGLPHSLVDAGHLVIAFRGEADGEPDAGDEVDEVRWCAPGEIPWGDLAFSSTEVALRALVAEGFDAAPAHPHNASPPPEPGPRRAARFCRSCGGRMRLPVEGELGHAVCIACASPAWSNPSTAASLLAVRESPRGKQVLLGRRADASRPGYGLWAGPAGYIEPGETAEEAAVREIGEETRVAARITGLISVYSDPGHIEVAYFGQTDDEPRPTREMGEVRWFTRDEVPWDELFDSCGASVRRLIERGLL
jgi:8-oxo-dGTP diphosphatase